MEGRWVSIHPPDEAPPPPRRVFSVAPRTRRGQLCAREPPRRSRNQPSGSRHRGLRLRRAHSHDAVRAAAARLGSATTMSGFKTHALPCTHSQAEKLPATPRNPPRAIGGRASARRRGIFKEATIFNSATINYACADHCLTYFRLPYRPLQPGRPAARLQRPTDKGYSELTS